MSENKDKEQLVENFFYLSLFQVACYIFPLLTIPYLARIIGTEGFGKIAFAAAVVSWIQIVVDWGFNYTATREVAKNRDDVNFVSDVFSNVFWAKCIISVVSLFFLIGLIVLIPLFRDNALVILVTYVMIFGNILFPSWFFQAIEKMKFVAIFNFVIKLIFTLFVFLFIDSPDDYVLQPFFISVGFLFCGMVSMWIILKRWKYKLFAPNLTRIFAEIKQSKDMFLNNLMLNSYTNFTVLLLGFFGGGHANGVFDGGNKFAAISQQFLQVVTRVFFPFLSRKTEKHSLYAILNMSVGVLFSLFLFICAPYIVEIFLSPEFLDSVIVLRILAVSIPFVAMNNVYGINYLVIVHQEKLLRNITLFSSFAGLLAAYPLISSFSYCGAAITVFISRFLLGCLACCFALLQKRKAK